MASSKGSGICEGIINYERKNLFTQVGIPSFVKII